VPGIGSIRIDLVANTAEFLRSMDNAEKRLRRWGRSAAEAVDDADKAFSKFGAKLTAKVTAPIVALGIAAYRAADPTKKLSNEMETFGRRATQALRPLGNVIADLLDQARPTINRGIGVVNALTESFERLDPETQRLAISIAGVAAAIGPTLLGLSALTSAAKFAGEAVSVLYGAGSKLLRLLVFLAPALGKLALAAGAVAAAFDLGNRIYNSFEFVQSGLAKLIAYNQSAAELVRHGWSVAIENILLTWRKLVAEVTGNGKLTNAISFALSSTGNYAAASAFSALAVNQTEPSESYGSLNARLAAEHSARQSAIDAALGAQLSGIRQDFAGREGGAPGPNTVLEEMLANLSRLGEISSEAFRPITDAFDRIAGRANEIAAASPSILSAEDIRLAGEQLKHVVAYSQRLQAEAMKVRLEAYPERQFAEDMARLRELRAAWPSIIDDRTFATKAQRIRDQLVALEAANGQLWARAELAVRGFADGAGEWFAGLVLKGKASFREILDSWTATLLSMVSKTLVFEPLARSIGAGVGSILGGPSVSQGYNNATALGARGTSLSAMGNVFDQSGMRRFGAGGVFTGPSYFQTADGRGNVVGEAGWEAAVPLERIGGKLGVNATGRVVVNVYNQAGADVGVQQSSGVNGERVIEVMVKRAVNRGLGDGSFDGAMNQNYGANRRGVKR